MTERTRNFLIVSGLMLLATVLRWIDIGTESLWVDEIYSYRQALKPIANIIANASADVHPPTYYILLRLWVLVFGTSEAALRSCSAFLGVIAVPFMYLLGKRLWNARLGLFAAFLLTISHFHIHYSQETRNYTYLVLVVLLGMLAFVRLLDEVREHGKPTRQTIILYILANTLLLYSHFFALFVTIAQNLYIASLLVFDRNFFQRVLKRWIVLQIVLLLIFSPWMNILYWQIKSVNKGFWIDEPTVFTLAETVIEYAGSLAASAVILPLVAFSIVELRQRNIVFANAEQKEHLVTAKLSNAFHIWLLSLWFVLPIIIPFLLSLAKTPIYYVKYTIPALPAFLLLAAKGMDAWDWNTRQGKIFVCGMLFTLCGIAAYNTRNDWNSLEKECWRQAAQYLHSRQDSTSNSVQSSDSLVFVHDWYCAHNLAYYGVSRHARLIALPPERLRLTPALWEKLYFSNIVGRDQICLVLSHKTARTQAILDVIERDFVRSSEMIFPSRYRKYMVSDSFPYQTRGLFLLKTYLSNDIRVIEYRRRK